MGGVAPHTTPVRARPRSLGAICAASWRVGAGSLVPRGSCGSRQLGRGGGPHSGSSLGRGEGGPSPLPRGVGAGAPAACGPSGGVGGGSRRGLPAPSLGGGPRFAILAPPVSSAHSPPACACGQGRGAAPGWGGMRGGPWTAPPGAPADLNTPSALPEWAVVMGGSSGARHPYCSDAPPCAAPRLVSRVAPARWCRLACRPRPPQEQPAGGAGARGVQVQPHPPPSPRRGPFWGRGGVLSAPGGRRVAPVAPQPRGGSAGGGWGGRYPASPPRRASACHLLSPACPPWGILVPWGLLGGRGHRARSGLPPMGQCGGGGGGAPWFAPPSSPGQPLKGLLRLRRPGRRRSAVGRQRAGRAGACGGRGAPSPRVQWPLRGGCGAAVSSVCLCPLLGLRGRGGGSGGGPLIPWRRPVTAEGGGHGGPGPGRQPLARGSHSSPAPLYQESDPRAVPRRGSSSPPPSLRGAGRPGAAVRVSGQR